MPYPKKRAIGTALRCALGALTAFVLTACTDADETARNAGPAKSAIDPADTHYSSLTQQGRQLEAQGKLSEALEKYREARGVRRYERESYYALLDIGRVHHKLGEYATAARNLTEYLNHVEIELKVLRGEMVPPSGVYVPDYTERGMKNLLADKLEAESLLADSRSKIKINQ